MFVRKKKNKSGLVSVQVIDKSTGSYKVVKTIGCSSDASVINELYLQGQKYIATYGGQQTLNLPDQGFSQLVRSSIKDISIAGVHLLFDKLYNEIGFNTIGGDLLRQLVYIRLSHPVSKHKSSQYLKRYFSVELSEDKIYRYLDELYEIKDSVQQISYSHTLKILGGEIRVVFYDVTTIYFQIDDEDEIRKRGFSKEGRHQNPQIVLGLLVSEGGYPLAYEVHEGNKFEGHTMLPIIDAFKEKYNIKKLVVIADSGLLSSTNIQDLQEKGYEFILGARIKNEKKTIKDKILSLKLENGQSHIIEKSSSLKLIVSYSCNRAKKDAKNREQGLKKLEKRIKTGKLTKSNINNRGYNKYLKMNGEIKIEIDYSKYNEDSKWDGLKGYLTNATIPKEMVLENYSHLWRIEKAFRVSKNDLKIRPIYHRLKRRIEAHVTLNFIAYKLYKELERQLILKKSDISCEKAIDIAKSIYAIKIADPISECITQSVLLLNEEQKELAKIFDF